MSTELVNMSIVFVLWGSEIRYSEFLCRLSRIGNWVAAHLYNHFQAVAHKMKVINGAITLYKSTKNRNLPCAVCKNQNGQNIVKRLLVIAELQNNFMRANFIVKQGD